MGSTDTGASVEVFVSPADGYFQQTRWGDTQDCFFSTAFLRRDTGSPNVASRSLWTGEKENGKPTDKSDPASRQTPLIMDEIHRRRLSWT